MLWYILQNGSDTKDFLSEPEVFPSYYFVSVGNGTECRLGKVEELLPKLLPNGGSILARFGTEPKVFGRPIFEPLRSFVLVNQTNLDREDRSSFSHLIRKILDA